MPRVCWPLHTEHLSEDLHVLITVEDTHNRAQIKLQRATTEVRKLLVPAEEMNRGKPNWEHLSEDLHVLITVEDTHNRAQIKLQRATTEVRKLLVPAVSRPPPRPPTAQSNT
ncbi:hypothetical protein CRUP_026314 [Coryphaenoides rupestris]|nr:hypothetical protein CRUP_026314 [Coryphaenoides rupestris]